MKGQEMEKSNEIFKKANTNLKGPCFTFFLCEIYGFMKSKMTHKDCDSIERIYNDLKKKQDEEKLAGRRKGGG